MKKNIVSSICATFLLFFALQQAVQAQSPCFPESACNQFSSSCLAPTSQFGQPNTCQINGGVCQGGVCHTTVTATATPVPPTRIPTPIPPTATNTPSIPTPTIAIGPPPTAPTPSFPPTPTPGAACRIGVSATCNAGWTCKCLDGSTNCIQGVCQPGVFNCQSSSKPPCTLTSDCNRECGTGGATNSTCQNINGSGVGTCSSGPPTNAPSCSNFSQTGSDGTKQTASCVSTTQCGCGNTIVAPDCNSPSVCCIAKVCPTAIPTAPPNTSVGDPGNEGGSSSGGGGSQFKACGSNNTGVSTAFGCVDTSGNGLFTLIFSLAIGVAGGIAFLLIILGGLKIVTSGGNPEAMNEGREIITSAIVGLLLIIFSVFILRFVGVNVLEIKGFG